MSLNAFAALLLNGQSKGYLPTSISGYPAMICTKRLCLVKSSSFTVSHGQFRMNSLIRTKDARLLRIPDEESGGKLSNQGFRAPIISYNEPNDLIFIPSKTSRNLEKCMLHLLV